MPAVGPGPNEQDPNEQDPDEQDPNEQDPNGPRHRQDHQHVQYQQHPQQFQPDHHDQEAPDMTATTLSRPQTRPPRQGAPVSSAAITLIDRSCAGLLQACAAHTAADRYVAAHLAALRSAAAVLAVRGRSSRGGPRSVWELLPKVAPELTEWATFFAATAARRSAIEVGRAGAVTSREADDLLRDAEAFQHAVEGVLGLPQYPVLPEALPTCH